MYHILLLQLSWSDIVFKMIFRLCYGQSELQVWFGKPNFGEQVVRLWGAGRQVLGSRLSGYGEQVVRFWGAGCQADRMAYRGF